MLSTREELIAALQSYSTSYQEEKEFIQKFLELLKHERSFHRDHLPGHITASAWIVDEHGEHVLLTHHAKLNRWLQPGGHADGEEDVLSVATREVLEETGLTSPELVGQIFDIDIHPIPARKDFPMHDHYDVRFLFKASKNEELVISDESTDLEWVSVNDLAERTDNNVSMLRMAEKAAKLL